jgi:hypothetical protein
MKAFPNGLVYGRELEGGMELRDYFAAKAMQGLLSTVKGEDWQYDDVSFLSYAMADEMMKAREDKDAN